MRKSLVDFIWRIPTSQGVPVHGSHELQVEQEEYADDEPDITDAESLPQVNAITVAEDHINQVVQANSEVFNIEADGTFGRLSPDMMSGMTLAEFRLDQR
jgi:hypothetical protein